MRNRGRLVPRRRLTRLGVEFAHGGRLARLPIRRRRIRFRRRCRDHFAFRRLSDCGLSDAALARTAAAAPAAAATPATTPAALRAVGALRTIHARFAR